MAATDIRALMAQERQSRRINHEFASYSKTGVLTCTACSLSIKSETLWDGHLRSTNHKANVKKLHQAPKPVVKRKIEDVEEPQADEVGDAGRKKLKPRTPSGRLVDTEQAAQKDLDEQQEPTEQEESTDNRAEPIVPSSADTKSQSAQPVRQHTVPIDAAGIAAPSPRLSSAAQVSVDEDEWAAFERDIAPLAEAPIQPSTDYSAATISAAPVSAAQLEAEAERDRKRLRDAEAEEEKEDEGRRIEEEFEVMEEMEERVRRLREKREALRTLGQTGVATEQEDEQHATEDTRAVQDEKEEVSEDESEDDVDDWYS